MTVVGAFQLAHVPVLPGAVAYQRSGREGQEPADPMEAAIAQLSSNFPRDGELMETMRQRLEELAPEVIVFFDSDHLNSFFLDHVPSIAVGVDEQTSGPSDHPLGHPHYERIPVDRELARALHSGLLEKEFDVSFVQRFEVDHSITVPLHFVTPAMDVPIVPIWINALGGPSITPKRARALGRAVRELLDELAPGRRVALISSGALSLEVGGPRIFPDTVIGIPNPGWVGEAAEIVARGDLEGLIARCTPEQFASNGNTAAEILNMIALMAALGEAPVPDLVEPLPGPGHAYATWSQGAVS